MCISIKKVIITNNGITKIHPIIMAKTFTITYYGETKEYPESQRKKMIKEFQTAMLCCDGSEAERYRNIYGDLIAGEKECMDTERPLSPELEEMIKRMFTVQE